MSSSLVQTLMARTSALDDVCGSSIIYAPRVIVVYLHFLYFPLFTFLLFFVIKTVQVPMA